MSQAGHLSSGFVNSQSGGPQGHRTAEQSARTQRLADYQVAVVAGANSVNISPVEAQTRFLRVGQGSSPRAAAASLPLVSPFMRLR